MAHHDSELARRLEARIVRGQADAHMAFVRRVHEGVMAGESLPQLVVNTYGVGDAPEGMVKRAAAVRAAVEVATTE